MGERIDHRKLPRRRGEELTGAIFDAVLDELVQHGYAQASIDRIAERAHASKASIYRRWPGKIELVLDAVAHHSVATTEPPDTGSLRGDLLAILCQTAKALLGPLGEVARGLVVDAVGDPELAEARDRVVDSRIGTVQTAIARARERGEIPDVGVSPLAESTGPVLLRHHFLTRGAPIPEELIVSIVDDVMLPLLQG